MSADVDPNPYAAPKEIAPRVEAPSAATEYAMESELADARKPVKLMGNIFSFGGLWMFLAASVQLFDRYVNHDGSGGVGPWWEWVVLVGSIGHIVTGLLLIRHSQALIFAGRLSTDWKLNQFEAAFRTQARVLTAMGMTWSIVFLLSVAGVCWQIVAGAKP